MSEGVNFLRKVYPNLHQDSGIEKSKSHYKRELGQVLQSPQDKIEYGLSRYEELLALPESPDKTRKIALLKKMLESQVIVKVLPQAYRDLQKKIAREQGQGELKITPEMEAESLQTVQIDQKTSLDQWVSYLASPDALYPIWLKYWALRNVLGLSQYDKKQKKFPKRTETTTTNFPDLEREALAKIVDAVEAEIAPPIPEQKSDNDSQIEQSNRPAENEEQRAVRLDFEKLLSTKNFAKMYAHQIEHSGAASLETLRETRGSWVRYPKGSDPTLLVKAIQGKGTGRCTGGESTATRQLSKGDFYVYYSRDNKKHPTVPRVAIRMEGDSIAEVRGVAEQQNIDAFIAPVVGEKMKEFGSQGEKYQKKSRDMAKITAIDKKVSASGELDKDDLRTLYEMNGSIEWFGYRRDPRIDKLLEGRDRREDLAFAAWCEPEEIGFSESDLVERPVKYYHGQIRCDLFRLPDWMIFPQSLRWGLFIPYVKSLNGAILPVSLGGGLYLDSVTSLEWVTLPPYVGGDLNIKSLLSLEWVTLPPYVGGVVYVHDDIDIEALRKQYPHLRFRFEFDE